MDHTIPLEWLVEAKMEDFRPTRAAYICEDEHTLIALDTIIRLKRNPGIVLDANGLGRDRMMFMLENIRAGRPLPPIDVQESRSEIPFELRDGFHRFYASVDLGFTHIPARIVVRLD